MNDEDAVTPISLQRNESFSSPTPSQDRYIIPITTNSPMSEEKEAALSPGRRKLRQWLGKTFRIIITDGRILVGFFNCTDDDCNIVLSMCAEYLEYGVEARILGNVMVPGKHIVSIDVANTPDDEAVKEEEAQPKYT